MTSWKELALTRPDQLHRQMAILPSRARVAEHPPAGFIPVDFFHSASVVAAESTALLGVSAVRPTIIELLPVFERALADMTPRTELRSRSVEAAAWFYILAQCVGVSLAEEAMDIVHGALSRFAPEPNFELSYAWAAAALLEDDLARSVAPKSARFLASLLGADDYEMIEPEWIDYLRDFPRAIANGQAAWPHAICAGRVVYNRLQGLPPADVARETHKQIMQLIAQGY